MSWTDIEIVKAHAAKEDYLQGWAEGRYPAPPFSELIGIRLVKVARGRAVFVGVPSESHYNPLAAPR